MNILLSDFLTVLPGEPFTLKKCDVYVSGSRIVSIDQKPHGFVPETTLHGSGKLLIPGLINAHTHAYMTLFRNCADDLSFSDWLFGRIMPMEDQLTGEDAYWTAKLGCMEMIAGGITSFLDMHMFPHACARAVEDTGIRAVLSRGLSGGENDKAGGDRRLREAMEEIDAWQGHERLSFMLAPHALYTCDEGYFGEIARLANDKGLSIHTHLSESDSEQETCQKLYGCTPTRLYERTGLLDRHTVAAHGVKLSEEDMDILACHDVTVAANPVSNLKLANGIAPIGRLLERGIPVALGTDGSASNNALSIFREMAFTSLLHKGTSGDPCRVTAQDTLKMATVTGAGALELNAGEIKPGALADLTILDLSSPHLRPCNHPIAALCYSADRSDVDTVVVNGEILYKDRTFTTIDTEEVYRNVQRICDQLGTGK